MGDAFSVRFILSWFCETIYNAFLYNLLYWHKKSFYTRKEFNFHRVVLVHEEGRHLSFLEHQYGLRDVK